MTANGWLLSCQICDNNKKPIREWFTINNQTEVIYRVGSMPDKQGYNLIEFVPAYSEKEAIEKYRKSKGFNEHTDIAVVGVVNSEVAESWRKYCQISTKD